MVSAAAVEGNPADTNRAAQSAPAGAALEVVEHEQANRGRQIALPAIAVDLVDQLRQRHAAQAGNLLHAVPECLLEADAGLVPGDDDRPLDDGGFHGQFLAVDPMLPQIVPGYSEQQARLRCDPQRPLPTK